MLQREFYKAVDVEGQRINLWRPRSLITSLRLVFSQTDRLLIPQVDVMDFVLPDPHLFRTTDVYSDDQIRGFRKASGRYPILGGEEAEYVLYASRSLGDYVMNGVAFRRDQQLFLLQTYLDDTQLEMEQRKIQVQQEQRRRELNMNLTDADLGLQR